MEGVRIEAIGPEDPRFAEWHAAIVRSYAHGREPGWWELLAATRIYFARASAQTRHVALVASLDGSVVGGAELSLPLDADLETMSVELGVLPDTRGRGVGDVLLSAVREVATREDRHVVQAEVFVPADLGPTSGPEPASRSGTVCGVPPSSTVSCSTCRCRTSGWTNWRPGPRRAPRG